jgi:cyclophilin family peptidyl-prolyl cis-trans isomerase
MKTNFLKSNRAVVLFIYVLAFVLMSWSYQAHAADKKNPVVVISTSLGDIKVELNSEKAPISTENFLHYVNKKHYDGTIFHRVIKGFMIQGGGHTPDLAEKPTDKPIKNEATNGLSNMRGTIAMARTEVVDSATSQFFINVVDNQRLDYVNPNRYGYAVFGKVIEGMDVVDAIRNVTTTSKNGMDDVPVDPVLIKSVRVEGAPADKKADKAPKKVKGKK